MNDPLSPYIRQILNDDFTDEYGLGLVISELSGKVSPFEATYLVNALTNAADDTAVQDMVNRLLTYVKLTYSDQAQAFEKKIMIRAKHEYKHELEKKKLMAQWEYEQRMQAQGHNRNVIEVVEEPIKNKPVSRPNQGIMIPTVIPPALRFKDELLTFMDKVNSGTVDNIEDDAIYVGELQRTYGVKLVKKGWIVPTYEFTDKAKAAEAREAIAGIKR